MSRKNSLLKESLKLNYENLSVTDFKVDAVNWPGTSEESFATEVDTCPTRTSGIRYFRDLQIFTFNYFQSWRCRWCAPCCSWSTSAPCSTSAWGRSSSRTRKRETSETPPSLEDEQRSRIGENIYLMINLPETNKKIIWVKIFRNNF